MTTRNKRCIRLVSLDGHKTLTPLIASKLRVSRVTAHYRSGQVPRFLSPSVPRKRSPSSPRTLRTARRNGRRDNHRDIASVRGLGMAEEPEGKRRSFLFSSLRLRDLVPRQFPRGSFGVSPNSPSCRIRSLPRRLPPFFNRYSSPMLRLVDRIS